MLRLTPAHRYTCFHDILRGCFRVDPVQRFDVATVLDRLAAIAETKGWSMRGELRGLRGKAIASPVTEMAASASASGSQFERQQQPHASNTPMYTTTSNGSQYSNSSFPVQQPQQPQRPPPPAVAPGSMQTSAGAPPQRPQPPQHQQRTQQPPAQHHTSADVGPSQYASSTAGGGGLFSSIKGGAGSFLRNLKDTSSKVQPTKKH